jgi:DAPG hydrolase PhiG domain
MEFSEANRLLDPGYLSFESGYKPLSDGKQLVAALTRMPGCRAKMVDWWFSWLGGTEQYKMWHPRDHIFSGWESRADGKYIGASHLVHEYLAGDSGPLYKLRINFRDPAEFFDIRRYRDAKVVGVCARIGDLEHPVDFGRMVHFVRDTDYGCEMRSRFWLGIIESRDPNVTISDEQARAMRHSNVNEELARRLHQHATEEMGYLAEILPTLYKRYTQDNTF